MSNETRTPPSKYCGATTPDRSGRSCDKPLGHDGDHWTYGGNEPTWPQTPPSSRWEQIPQYDLITNYRAGSSIEEMERADDGEWVRWEAVVAARAADASQIKDLQRWKDAVTNALVVDWCLNSETENDPRKALAALIEWNIQIHDDPAVSKVAAEREARVSALSAQVEQLTAELQLARSAGSRDLNLRLNETNKALRGEVEHFREELQLAAEDGSKALIALADEQRKVAHLTQEKDAIQTERDTALWDFGELVIEQVKVEAESDALRQQVESLQGVLRELQAVVMGECPSLLNEDSGGDARLAMRIDAALSQPSQAEPQS